MEGEWYYAVGGQQKGPVSEAALRELLARGEVQAGDLVWRDGMAQWQPAGQVLPMAAGGGSGPVGGVTEGAGGPEEWYYGTGGQQQGPVSEGTLRRLVGEGRVSPADLVWREGMAEWRRAVEVLPGLVVPAVPVGGTGEQIGYYNPQAYLPAVPFGGFWWRVLALFIDGIVTGVAGGIIGAVLGATMGAAGAQELAITIVGQLVGIVLGWLYEALMTSSQYQATLGKMACGMKVVKSDGSRLSFGRATGRHFAKNLSALTLGIGYIMVAFTQKKQGLHDFICDTVVIRPGVK